MKAHMENTVATPPAVRVSALDALDTNLMDVQIWVVMSDFKKRTAKEIVDRVAALGYHRIATDKRLDSLIRSKKWFERSNSSPVTYVMKKDVRKPVDGKAVVMKAGEVKVGLRIGENITVKALSEALSVSPAVICKYLFNRGITATINQVLDYELAKEVSEQYNQDAVPRPHMVADSFNPSGNNDGINLDRRDINSRPFVAPVGIAASIAAQSTPKSIKPEADLNPAQSAPDEPIAAKPKNVGHPPIVAGDPIDLAIWKIMHDYQPYTANEVALLLQDFGFKPASVKPRMSVLFGNAVNGWFTRIADPKNYKQFIYTLKHEIEMPTIKDGQKIPTQVAVMPAKAVEPEVKEVAASTPTEPKEPQQMTAQLAAVPAPTVTYPLFAVDVVIKGKVFSLEEARVLGNELLEGGFGEEGDGKESAPPKFLKVKVEIAGEHFTMDEANELALTMLKEGLIKKTT